MTNVNIKKQFAEIHSFLEENQDKKVKTIMAELEAMMSKKAGGGTQTFIKDDDGNVTHIFCYYHKKWEDVTVAEYGSKAGTATGLNTMCKEGVSQWTKQQRAKKAAESALLEKVAKGELAPADIPAEQEKIAEEAKVVVPREDGHGEDSL